MNTGYGGMALVAIIAALIGGLAGTSLRGNEGVHTGVSTSTDESALSTPDPTDFISPRPGVAALPSQTISSTEKADLLFMREEEKLARDVYTVLYETWNLPIFANIAQSEQTHTEAVRALLVKYEIPDVVADDTVGTFVDPTLQGLYTKFVTEGAVSLDAALRVGATIEDLDIADLQVRTARTDNDDIKLVYGNLERGSRNHLRSFVQQITARGGTYVPEYISQEAFTAIIDSPRETGGGSGGQGKRGWGNR